MSPQKILGYCDGKCPWHRQLVLNMLKILSEKALILNKKLEYVSIKSMREKLGTYFLDQYRRNKSLTFMLPLNRNELADFLNVSRPSMSREMSRMKDDGIIDFHMSTVRILDFEALKNMIVS
jgi:CRP-like cAMP-binding protein